MLTSFFYPLSAQDCGWQDVIIGNAASGSAIYDICNAAATATISTNAYTSLFGSVIDGQNFIYHDLCGDGELVVRLMGINPANGLYGIEFRSGLEAGAMKFGIKKSDMGNSITEIRRMTPNAPANNLPIILNQGDWFKITRSGDTFTAYASTDGANWNLAASADISMPECIEVGMLAHASNMVQAVSAAQFADIELVEAGDNGGGVLGNDIPFCGTFKKDLTYYRGVDTTIQDYQYFDRFGNGYLLDELMTYNYEKSGGQCTNSGFFNISYLGNDFSAAERETICQVFHDLSELINPANDEVMVGINVQHVSGVNYGAAATDIHFADVCGISNSTIMEAISGGLYSSDFVHGIMNINTDISWHYLSEDGDNPSINIGANDLDLYSAVLHEALHILGISSLITEDGSSDLTSGDAYSRWDSYLYSTNENTNLIIPDSENEECCSASMFNSNTFTPMPGALSAGCDLNIYFSPDGGGTLIAPVNDVDENGNANSTSMTNKLSHLPITCATNLSIPYVMNAGLLPHEIRRIIAPEEKTILCHLGYDLTEGTCSEVGDCALLINDDGPFQIIMSESLEISLQGFQNGTLTFLENDMLPGVESGVIPTGNLVFTVSLNEDCGNTDGLTIQHLNQDLNNPIIKITATEETEEGIYSFCYEVTSCNGWCGEGEITIYVREDPILNCPMNDCNLLCFGDFEDFMEGTSNYFTQLGLATFGWGDSNTGTVENANSPDISIQEDGNHLLHLYQPNTLGDGGGDHLEGVYSPLSAPIEAGCEISVSFDAAATLVDGGHVLGEPVLYFYLLSGAPCEVMNYPGGCENSFEFCSGVTGICIQEVSISEDGNVSNDDGIISNLDLIHKEFNWENQENTAYEYLLIMVGNSDLEDARSSIYLDNLNISMDCQNVVGVTSEDVTGCIGERVEIPFSICLSGDESGDIDVNFQLNLNDFLLPGMTFIANDDFDEIGAGTITLANGECITVTALIDIGVNIVPGAVLPLELEIVSTSADNSFCIDVEGEGTTPNLTIYDCTCPTPDVSFTYESDACGITYVTAVNNDPDQTITDENWEWTIGGTTQQGVSAGYPYSESGNYVVSLTATNDCGESTTVEQTITIQITPDPVIANIEAVHTEGAPCGEYTFTATGENISSYIWADETGNQLGTTNPLVFTFAENGAYIITLTASNECGDEVTRTVKIEVMCHIEPLACGCTGDNTINIHAGDGTSIWDTELMNSPNLYQIWTKTYFFYNTCLAIQGNLILDQGMKLSIFNGEIKMQPGATITVEKGAALNLQNVDDDMDGDGKSGIHGCERMWRGIVLEAGTSNTDMGGQIGWMQNTIIQDAQYAITAMPNSKLGFLLSNTFTRNHVGIYSPEQEVGVDNQPIYTSYLEENTFTTTDGTPLLPYFDEEIAPLYDMDYPYAGIFINNASFTLGHDNALTPKNYFSFMRNGIVGNGADMMIFGAQIEGRIPSAGLYDYSGKGILLEECYGVLNHNNISYIYAGISASQGHYLKVNHNIISSERWGVINAYSLSYFEVKHNFISFKFGGIISQSCGENNIRNNEIENLDFNSNITAGGIVITTDQNFGLWENHLHYNTISLFNECDGIRINGSSYAVIEDNIVDLFDENYGYGYGIFLVQSDNSLLSNNNVSSSYLSDGDAEAYTLLSSENTRLCCNYSNNWKTGFLFQYACNNTQLRYSNIGNHKYGLAVDGIIGQQGSEDDPEHFGNLWTGTYTGFGAVNYDAVGQGDNFDKLRNDSGFFIEAPMSSQFWPPSWANNAPNFDRQDEWFVQAVGYSPSCEDDTQNCNEEPVFIANDIKGDDIKAAKGEYTGKYADMYNWESQRHLYDKLSKNPQLLGQDVDVDAFKANAENGAIGKLHTVKEQSQSLFSVTESQQVALDNYQQQVQDNLQEIIIIDSLLADTINAVDTLSLQQQREGVLVEIQDVVRRIRSVNDTIRQNRLAGIDAVIASNAAIPEVSLLAQNQKRVNEVFFNTIGKDIFVLDSTQFSVIKEIAEQCPGIGGDAVYRARVLYQLEEERNFDQEDLCSGKAKNFPTPETNGAGKPEATGGINLFPNPCKDYLSVEIGEQYTGQTLELSMYNLNGNKVKNATIIADGSTPVINIADLTNGVYYCHIKRDGNIEKTLRVVIMH